MLLETQSTVALKNDCMSSVKIIWFQFWYAPHRDVGLKLPRQLFPRVWETDTALSSFRLPLSLSHLQPGVPDGTRSVEVNFPSWPLIKTSAIARIGELKSAQLATVSSFHFHTDAPMRESVLIPWQTAEHINWVLEWRNEITLDTKQDWGRFFALMTTTGWESDDS